MRGRSRALVAVVGPGTADAVRGLGIEPDVVPLAAVGESLAESLSGWASARALVAGPSCPRHGPDALRAAGAEVDLLSLYRTVAAPLDAQTPCAVLAADWVTFASASAGAITPNRGRRPGAIGAAPCGGVDRAGDERRAARDRSIEPALEATGAHPRRLTHVALVAATGDAG